MRILTDMPDEDIEKLDTLAKRPGKLRAVEICAAIKLYLVQNAESNDWLKRKPEALVELACYKGYRMSHIVWTEILASEALDARIAMAAPDLHYRLGMKILDIYILATAQINGAILIIRNTKGFPAIMPEIHVSYTL
jgi:hypothetical protein